MSIDIFSDREEGEFLQRGSTWFDLTAMVPDRVLISEPGLLFVVDPFLAIPDVLVPLFSVAVAREGDFTYVDLTGGGPDRESGRTPSFRVSPTTPRDEFEEALDGSHRRFLEAGFEGGVRSSPLMPSLVSLPGAEIRVYPPDFALVATRSSADKDIAAVFWDFALDLQGVLLIEGQAHFDTPALPESGVISDDDLLKSVPRHVSRAWRVNYGALISASLRVTGPR